MYETEVQLASIYVRIIPPNSSLLNVEVQSVQQQEGAHDCGLFAVANAVEVCVGGNPEMVQFEQSKMRSHLINCLEQKCLQPFPKCRSTSFVKDSPPRPTRTKKIIKLYCSCRMPEAYDTKMISCDVCKAWYISLQLCEFEISPTPY